MFDYVIVGSGFSGSVLAERIASQLDRKVLVIEKRRHIGGNCFDFRDENGILVHKYGPHLFHTNNEKVWEYLSRFTKWHYYQHRVLALIDGQKVPIPFNFNSMDRLFTSELASRLQGKLLRLFGLNTKIPILELKKVDDPDIQFLANYVYEKVFLNYTLKQWGLKPEEIDPLVTARVPLFIGRDDRYFNDKYQAVPKEGYTKLIENMLNHPNIKLMLNTDFKEIGRLEEGKIYLFGKEFHGKLIYTGAIDELFDYKFGILKYRSLWFDFQTIDAEFYQEVACVNYPNDYDYTRITEYKHIHPVASAKTKIAIEYPEAFECGKNERYYPMFTEESMKQYGEYAEYARNFNNLILVGRLAEYKYYDMNSAVSRALEVFETLSERIS